jgi:hypothetical protein
MAFVIASFPAPGGAERLTWLWIASGQNVDREAINGTTPFALVPRLITSSRVQSGVICLRQQFKVADFVVRLVVVKMMDFPAFWDRTALALPDSAMQ